MKATAFVRDVTGYLEASYKYQIHGNQSYKYKRIHDPLPRRTQTRSKWRHREKREKQTLWKVLLILCFAAQTNAARQPAGKWNTSVIIAQRKLFAFIMQRCAFNLTFVNCHSELVSEVKDHPISRRACMSCIGVGFNHLKCINFNKQ